MDKIKIFILFVLLVYVAGCAGQRFNISKPHSQYADNLEKNPKAVSHFIRGCISELRNDSKNALLEFTESLLFDSSSATIYNKVAEQYIKLKKLESAQRILASAIRRFPESIESYKLIAAIHYSQRDFEKAELTYKRIIEIEPDNIEARNILISLYLAQGKDLAVAEEYENIIKLGDSTPQERIQVGNIYIQHKMFDKAEKIFSEFLKDFPDDERSYLGIAKVNLAKEDTAKAISWYKKGVAKNPEFETCIEELRDIYIDQKKWDDAVVLLQEIIKQDSSRIENYLRLGELYYQKGDTTQALDEFRQVIEYFNDDFRAYFSLGSLYFQQSNWENAEKYLLKSVELQPDFVRGWILAGFIYLRNNELDKAKEHFKRALKEVPDDIQLNYYMGSLLNQKNEADDALPYLEKCLEMNPDHIDAISTLAMIYEGKKEYSRSDSLYQIALQARPNDALLMNNYSYSLSVRGVKLEQAKEMAMKAVSADSTNGAYLDTLGWIFFKLGDFNSALDYISRAVQVRSESAEVWEHLGDVYEQLNDWENAEKNWRKSLELDSSRDWLLEKLKKYESSK